MTVRISLLILFWLYNTVSPKTVTEKLSFPDAAHTAAEILNASETLSSIFLTAKVCNQQSAALQETDYLSSLFFICRKYR